MMPNALAFEVTKRGPDAHGSVWIDIGVLVDGEPFGQVFVADVEGLDSECPVAWRHFSFDPDQYAEAVEGLPAYEEEPADERERREGKEICATADFLSCEYIQLLSGPPYCMRMGLRYRAATGIIAG